MEDILDFTFKYSYKLVKNKEKKEEEHILLKEMPFYSLFKFCEKRGSTRIKAKEESMDKIREEGIIGFTLKMEKYIKDYI